MNGDDSFKPFWSVDKSNIELKTNLESTFNIMFSYVTIYWLKKNH